MFKDVIGWKVEFGVAVHGDRIADLFNFAYQVQAESGEDNTEAFKEWLEPKLYAGCRSFPLSLHDDGIVRCKVVWRVDRHDRTSEVQIEDVAKLSRHLEQGIRAKDVADRINDWLYEHTKKMETA